MVLLQVVEIVVPELEEMRAAHVVSIGCATLCSLNPYCESGYAFKLFSDFSNSKTLSRSLVYPLFSLSYVSGKIQN